MRIEIHRWLMAMAPRADGRVAVAYDILVPLEDCPPAEGRTIRVRPGEGEYLDYASATWSTDLPRGWDRYKAWLQHERNAHQQMLRYLHEHCPETRELDRWPTLWHTSGRRTPRASTPCSSRWTTRPPPPNALQPPLGPQRPGTQPPESRCPARRPRRRPTGG